MRLNRVGWGVVGAGAGGLAWVIVATIEHRVLGTASSRGHLAIAGLTAGAVLWLADHFGLLSAPYDATTTFSLREEAPPVPYDVSFFLPAMTKVHQHREVIEDFMLRVMGVDAVWYDLSDDTELSDFAPHSVHPEHWHDRARLFYGIELAEIEPCYLWAIAERIHASEARLKELPAD